MTLTAPEWLTKRGGELRLRPDSASWAVVLDGAPLYVLTSVPAEGKHACRVMQTNNGARLDQGGTYATVEAALLGGLEDLRQALGW